ncbi:MAG: uracil phosphoribosyltransferase [Mogibacterium sp.]|nr:uracil phosphoribosyltransferase [Mogibacterium sp.]
MGTIMVFDHPLIQHKVSLMRDKNTTSKEFRNLAREVAMLMAFEVTRDLPTKDVEIETPICPTTVKMLEGKDVAIIPILRAGLGFVDGMLEIIPNAKVGHVGLYRDPETHEPVEYYCKLPEDIDKRKVIIVDPMLATGGSAIAAVDFVKKKGAKDISLMFLIAAPEGIKALTEAHPDVDIYIAAKDEKLNENAYIVPGLGDAGDRIFGTK